MVNFPANIQHEKFVLHACFNAKCFIRYLYTYLLLYIYLDQFTSEVAFVPKLDSNTQ